VTAGANPAPTFACRHDVARSTQKRGHTRVNTTENFIGGCLRDSASVFQQGILAEKLAELGRFCVRNTCRFFLQETTVNGCANH
jgi:hypothetical protein